MPVSSSEPVAYLRAATAGIRHHIRQAAALIGPAGRHELDTLHAHLAVLHRLFDELVARSVAEAPAEGAHLQAARIRVWQAAALTHDAFHAAPPATPGQLPIAGHCQDLGCEAPAGTLLTICQRHLASGATVRLRTTPADLRSPVHGHVSYPRDREETP
ncbi:DUF6238 family protein [Streptomyces hainanensis]|uniref:Uncharacterized protein n=1 Tax=Streptomyces hainanensis TaxID=402648 RepID=A0A4R4T6L7_9ACTN|nr:DUF6238 family protein [Streptomyces hainanensis]TDC72610.1 hypothetical protein E1283_21230 [Streptomyces hainanensis]